MTGIKTLAMAGLFLLPLCALAQSPAATLPHAGTAANPLPPEAVELSEMLWTARPLIVFAATPNDPAFQRQMQLLATDPGELTRRGVLIIADTDAANPSELRRRFRPNGFAILLIDTNGRVLLTRPTPRSIREISSAIDSSPLRQQELDDRRFQDNGSGG